MHVSQVGGPQGQTGLPELPSPEGALAGSGPDLGGRSGALTLPREVATPAWGALAPHPQEHLLLQAPSRCTFQANEFCRNKR